MDKATKKPVERVYTALGNVEVDGEQFAPGADVKLAEDRAEPLVKDGVLALKTPA